MRGGQPGHHIAVHRWPSAVVVHAVSEPQRPVVNKCSGGLHVDFRGGGRIERPHDCVAGGQLTGGGDAARLQPQVVAHGCPEHAPPAVEAANKPYLFIDLDHQPAGLHRAARRAGASGQGGNDYAMGEGEQKSWGRRRVDHCASPVEVKGIHDLPELTQEVDPEDLIFEALEACHSWQF